MTKDEIKETEKKKVLKNGIKAIDLLTILEKTNAYGLSNFKKLMNK